MGPKNVADPATKILILITPNQIYVSHLKMLINDTSCASFNKPLPLLELINSNYCVTRQLKISNRIELQTENVCTKRRELKMEFACIRFL